MPEVVNMAAAAVTRYDCSTGCCCHCRHPRLPWPERVLQYPGNDTEKMTRGLKVTTEVSSVDSCPDLVSTLLLPLCEGTTTRRTENTTSAALERTRVKDYYRTRPNSGCNHRDH